MEDKRDDEKLDLLFTGSINPVETEPSDRFWGKASEEILKRENNGYKRKVFAWRSAALLLASAVVLLSGYTFYIHSKVNSIEQKIAVIEKQQRIMAVVTKSKQEGTTNSVTNMSVNNQPTTSGYLQNDKKATPVTGKAIPGIASSSSGSSYRIKTPGNKTTLFHLPENSAVPDDSSYKEQVLLNSSAAGTNVPDGKTANINTSVPIHKDSIISYQSGKDSSSAEKDKPLDIAIAKTKPDTLSNQVLPPPKSKDTRTLTQRLSISAFFAPKVEDDYLRGTDESSNTTSKDIKTREANQFAFSAGFRLGYDISPHLSVFTGLYYHASSFSVKPVLVTAQQQGDGEIGYSVATSSGVVNFTDAVMKPMVGDSIKASIQSSRNYITIPLQLRYDIMTSHRLGFYAMGGIAINFAYNNATEIHWENTLLQEGDIVIRDIPDIDNVQYAYTLAAGIKYLFAKRFSFFVEPGFQGSFAAINKNAPIKAYPLLFGLSTGLTYHF